MKKKTGADIFGILVVFLLMAGCEQANENNSLAAMASESREETADLALEPAPEPRPAPEVFEPAPEVAPAPPPPDPVWAWDQPRGAISKNYPSTLLFGISYQLEEEDLAAYLAEEFREAAPSDEENATGVVRNAPANQYEYLGPRIECIPRDVLDCGDGTVNYQRVTRDPIIWQHPVAVRENVNARGQVVIDVFGKRSQDSQPEQLETIPSIDIPIQIEREPLWRAAPIWIVEHWETLAGIGAIIGAAIGALAAALRRRRNQTPVANEPIRY